MRTHLGFTLVELMITVAILAIIAGIAIPAYNGYLETARSAEGMNNIAGLQLAEEEYFLENNRYIAGSFTATVTTLSASNAIQPDLGWTPNEATPEFDYVVTTCPAPGTIATCYTITATGRGNSVPATVVLTN